MMGAPLVLAVFAFLAAPALCAQEPSLPELLKMAKNPFADVIKVPLSATLYLDAGPHHRMGSDLQVQPFFPIQLDGRWLLIPRIVCTAVT